MEPAKLLPEASQGEPDFRWRGGGVSRIEGLSDGVFALALTFLIVTLQVPGSVAELTTAFLQVPVFALTYASFAWLWFLHHQFHRRYGLEDTTTVTWNLVLLFLVLLYVYPLRFLATFLCQQFGIVPARPVDLVQGITLQDTQRLMLLYSGGSVALFGTMTMMYRNAWARRDDLGLDPVERILTRGTLLEMEVSMAIGILSLALASIDARLSFFSGIVYCLMGPVHAWLGGRTGKQVAALRKGAAASAPPGA